MPAIDLIIRQGTLVLPDQLLLGDLAIAAGQIVAIAPTLNDSGATELDASGLHVIPGLIDAHVHFDEPGRTAWEGFASGSRAIALGGGTTYFDMPLNAHPPTIDAASFDQKLAAARVASQTDFALWGGLIPGNLADLPALAARGVIGFKAFMSTTGTSDFPAADDLTLYAGMAEAAPLGLLVAVHAENDALTAALAQRAIKAGQLTMRDYLRSRPIVAELEAIGRAITFAADTGCRLHIVHVSSGRGVALVAEARARGVDVSCETCAHYLYFTEEDAERLGAVAKCAPPLRAQAEQDALWAQIAAGNLPIVTSDHSPAPPTMKTGADYFAIWGGIAGCQSTLAALLTANERGRQLPLPQLISLISAQVADRFNLPTKGRIARGLDADLALVDLNATSTLAAADLAYRHQLSPYVDQHLQGRVVRTILRGQTIQENGQPMGPPRGQLLTPARHH